MVGFLFVPILSNLSGTEPIMVILWKEIACLVLAELHHSRKTGFDQYNPSVQIVVISDSHFWSGASALKFRFNRLALQISNRDAFNIFGQQLIGLVSIQNRFMFPGVIATALNRCHATTDQANGELIFVSLDHEVLPGLPRKVRYRFFRKVAFSSRRTFSRLSRTIAAYWSFWSSNDCPSGLEIAFLIEFPLDHYKITVRFIII